MSVKKHICGVYKGHRIVQEYEQIGNGIYSTFYPCQKKGNRWYKIKDVASSNIDNIKKYINNHDAEK
jgi:hypothetical protein